MRNTGLRRPGVNALICFAMFLGGCVSVWSGVVEMNALGHETLGSAAKIGIGLLVGIIGFLFMFNFLWGVRVVNALRRGENVIARWTVTRETFEAFRENDRRRSALGQENDYRPPRDTPAKGVEFIFAADGVLAGDTYFGLSSTGLARFQSVQVLPENPLCIEFGMSLTTGSNLTVVQFRELHGVLRIPVARTATAEAKKVLAHYQDVLARNVIVNPGFWPRRVRLGLATALVSVLISAAGFGLNAAKIDLGLVPLIMAVAGAVFAVGGLVLAFIAYAFSRKQRYR